MSGGTQNEARPLLWQTYWIEVSYEAIGYPG